MQRNPFHRIVFAFVPLKRYIICISICVRYVYTYTYTHKHTHTHERARARVRRRTRTHTNADAHARTHIYTQTHTHTHAHTVISLFMLSKIIVVTIDSKLRLPSHYITQAVRSCKLPLSWQRCTRKYTEESRKLRTPNRTTQLALLSRVVFALLRGKTKYINYWKVYCSVSMYSNQLYPRS